MSWYAYCITEQRVFQGSNRARRPFPIENLRGINDTQVFGYPNGEFAIIVSEYIPGSGLTQKSIVEHARVVAECFRNTTVLPFKFGTVFDTDEALRRAVRANRKAFISGVNRLKGKAEMHLKLMVKDGSLREASADENLPLPLTPGGVYLTKLREKAARYRERQTKARAISVQVHKLFSPLEEEVSCKRMDSGGMLIDIAHLVD